MAIHADYPGLTVEIYVDGKPLEEYKNSEEEDVPKTTTRYVECRSGAEFAIRTSFNAPFTPADIAVWCSVDGIPVHGKLAKKHELLESTYIQDETTWKDGAKWRASRFLFSDLSIVEDTDGTLAKENPDTLCSVGNISVTLTEVLSYRTKSRPRGRKVTLRAVGLVSEDAVKGDVRSHTIRLAPDRALKAPVGLESRLAKKPLVTFQFKYRSIAALRSLGLIPRSPSPSPVPQPELIKKEELPESIPNVPSSARSSSAFPRSKSASASATPALLQRRPYIRTHHDQSKLTKKDMLILIKHYRGSSEGLESLPEKELAILLGSYRDDEPEPTTPIKREPVDDGDVRRQVKKRKPEVIVLDD